MVFVLDQNFHLAMLKFLSCQMEISDAPTREQSYEKQQFKYFVYLYMTNSIQINKVLPVFIYLSLIIASCEMEDRFYKFTDSELEWININDDDFIEEILYLRNKTDTLIAKVHRYDGSSEYCRNEYRRSHYHEYYEEKGYSLIIIEDSIHVRGKVDIYSYEEFVVRIEIPTYTYSYVSPNLITDTALVNDILYEEAHKYHVSTSDENDAAYFCFVKGKGYVQIILNDGTLLELIN